MTIDSILYGESTISGQKTLKNEWHGTPTTVEHDFVVTRLSSRDWYGYASGYSLKSPLRKILLRQGFQEGVGEIIKSTDNIFGDSGDVPTVQDEVERDTFDLTIDFLEAKMLNKSAGAVADAKYPASLQVVQLQMLNKSAGAVAKCSRSMQRIHLELASPICVPSDASNPPRMPGCACSLMSNAAQNCLDQHHRTWTGHPCVVLSEFMANEAEDDSSISRGTLLLHVYRSHPAGPDFEALVMGTVTEENVEVALELSQR
eukprot:scaffold20624_cov22-Tisochrysis_lutea.AAC.3